MARSDRIGFQLPVPSAPAIWKPIPVSRYRQTLPPGQQVCSAYPFQARILRCRMPPEAFSPYRMRPRTGPPQSAGSHCPPSRFAPMKSLISLLWQSPAELRLSSLVAWNLWKNTLSFDLFNAGDGGSIKFCVYNYSVTPRFTQPRDTPSVHATPSWPLKRPKFVPVPVRDITSQRSPSCSPNPAVPDRPALDG